MEYGALELFEAFRWFYIVYKFTHLWSMEHLKSGWFSENKAIGDTLMEINPFLREDHHHKCKIVKKSVSCFKYKLFRNSTLTIEPYLKLIIPNFMNIYAFSEMTINLSTFTWCVKSPKSLCFSNLREPILPIQKSIWTFEYLYLCIAFGLIF